MSLTLKNKKLPKIILITTVIYFLLVNTFGLLYHMSEMKIEEVKSNCLFSDQTNGCDMNFSEHITLWQGMTLSLPQNTIEITDALLLLVTLALAFTFYRNYILEFSRRISSRFRLYIKQHPQINLFNYLKEVFSSGILNKKIYKLATI